jgi:hypothetical protein
LTRYFSAGKPGVQITFLFVAANLFFINHIIIPTENLAGFAILLIT